jgi:hypothetical protein
MGPSVSDPARRRYDQSKGLATPLTIERRGMSLLHQIQSSLMEEGQKIGPILLKLQFLASRLGSAPLETWVKYEADGNPHDTEVPDYRLLPVSYIANFSGPFGSGVRNAPIPPYLIEKFAGHHWNRYEIRQSIAAIDDLLTSADRTDRGNLQINASNLILLLQGNVYKDYACNSVTGTLSKASLSELQNSVRTRILELTIELEKSIPAAGIPRSEAEELAEIVASEEPEDDKQPFGKKAKSWIARNIGKAIDGTWKIGIAVATSVLTEAALQYYGHKQS